jgi:hypothetical protein
MMPAQSCHTTPHRLRENKHVLSATTRVPSLHVIGNRFPDSEEIGKTSRNQGWVCLMVGINYCSGNSDTPGYKSYKIVPFTNFLPFWLSLCEGQGSYRVRSMIVWQWKNRCKEKHCGRMVGILCSHASELWSEREQTGGGKREIEASVERVHVPWLGQM